MSRATSARSVARCVSRVRRGAGRSRGARAVAARPAGAAEVARVHYGCDASRRSVAAPDGGAWVLVERGGGANAIGRAQRRRDALPHGRRSTRSVDGAAIGPDGQAWFRTGWSADLRAWTATARLTSVGHAAGPRGHDPRRRRSRPAPDGRLWARDVARSATIAHVSAAGRRSTLTCTEDAARCRERSAGRSPMERASRRRACGSPTPAATGSCASRPPGADRRIACPTTTSRTALAADAGRRHVVRRRRPAVGHVDAAGAVTHLAAPRRARRRERRRRRARRQRLVRARAAASSPAWRPPAADPDAGSGARYAGGRRSRRRPVAGEPGAAGAHRDHGTGRRLRRDAAGAARDRGGRRR